MLSLWCPLMTSEYVDLGTFTAVADSDTRFVVDGETCDMDAALDRYGDLWGFTKLRASEPGRLVSMEFGTRRMGSA